MEFKDFQLYKIIAAAIKLHTVCTVPYNNKYHGNFCDVAKLLTIENSRSSNFLCNFTGGSDSRREALQLQV